MSLLIFFFVAIGIGWILGRFQARKKQTSSIFSPPSLYKSAYPFVPTVIDRATDVFIKMLEASPDTIESHIALGNLFRSKGELGKAIQIHQSIIGRSTLTSAQRSAAVLALAQDFMSAGLLDRAEHLFADLYKGGEYKQLCLEFLADLYEKEKDWEQAIETANNLSQQNKQQVGEVIAHYYCELAEKSLAENQMETARQYLKNALQHDKKCARVSILTGQIEMQLGDYDAAVVAYQQVKQQNGAFLPQVLSQLKECYQKIGRGEVFLHFLENCLKEHKSLSLILVLAEQIQIKEGYNEAVKFMLSELRKQPSLRGLYHLIGYYMEAKAVKGREDVLILKNFIGKLLESKPLYRCHFCGFSGKTLHWQCPNCKKWGTTVPTEEQEETT